MSQENKEQSGYVKWPIIVSAVAVIALCTILISVAWVANMPSQSIGSPGHIQDHFAVVDPLQPPVSSENQIVYEPPGIAELYENLRFASNPGGLSFIGSVSSLCLSSDTIDALETCINRLEAYDYSVGFVLIDITTGQGIAYNADEQFYSASAIKGIYVAALVSSEPELLTDYYDSIASILIYSDNDAYVDLFDSTNWLGSLDQWYLEADTVLDDFNHCFPQISARDMARLWLRNYEYFSSEAEPAQELAELYTTPNRSPINAVLGAIYLTYTKAGWGYETGILDDGSFYTLAANDAGLVYAGEDGSHPYVIAIMSDLAADLDRLEDLVVVLNRAHDEIVAELS